MGGIIKKKIIKYKLKKKILEHLNKWYRVGYLLDGELVEEDKENVYIKYKNVSMKEDIFYLISNGCYIEPKELVGLIYKYFQLRNECEE